MGVFGAAFGSVFGATFGALGPVTPTPGPATPDELATVRQANARLLWQFQQKPQIKALLSALVSPIQEVRDAYQDLLTLRSLDTAVGAQLDVLGRIVGQLRGGLDDDVYRSYLRVRVMVDRSRGTSPEIVKIARAFIGADAGGQIELDNQGEAAFVVRLLGLLTLGPQADALVEFLQTAASAGVRAIVESEEGDLAVFRWDSSMWDTDFFTDARDVATLID